MMDVGGRSKSEDFPFVIFHFSFAISEFELGVALEVEYTSELIVQSPPRW